MSETSQLFPTPVLVLEVPDSPALNDALHATIQSARATEASVGRSVVGGWHSDPGFLARPDPALQTLAGHIRGAVLQLTRSVKPDEAPPLRLAFDLEGWANVLDPGGYHEPHNHPASAWSGVYWVDTGDDGGDPGRRGRLSFLDPRAGANALLPWQGGVTRDFVPRAGLLVAFPGWLTHLVHPFRGTGHRISVSFNVGIRVLGEAAG